MLFDIDQFHWNMALGCSQTTSQSRDFVIRLTGDWLGGKSPCRCFPMHITLLAYGQLRVCEIRSKFGRKESAGFQYLAFKYLLSMEQQVNSFINSFVDYIFRFSNHTTQKSTDFSRNTFTIIDHLLHLSWASSQVQQQHWRCRPRWSESWRVSRSRRPVGGGEVGGSFFS